MMLSLTASATGSPLNIVYYQPSEKWTGALPLGNGRLGAMIYGGCRTETIALNEVTLWSGQPDSAANDLCGPEKLHEMREAFLSGDYRRGNELGKQGLTGHGRSFGTHLPFGDLLISDESENDRVTDYVRSLDISEAMARVGYTKAGVHFTREYFASNPAHALIVRYTASKREAISVGLAMRMLRHSTVKATCTSSACGDLDITGDARFEKNGEGGVRFHGLIHVQAEGGSVKVDGNVIRVEHANALTIICDIRTDFQNAEYENLCRQTVTAAASRSYGMLKKDHVTDYQRLFNRMSVRFGDGKEADFDALFFQYGRYMQISSSREDSPLPSNLQGIWNDNLACNMPWTCDYHLDINIQQNYWSTNVGNLAECNTPLFSYLGLLARYGSETARKVYGCNGWVAHTINNIWGDTAPGNSCSWAMNVTAGAWLATHLWTHFEFTQDKDYLRETGYPLLKETAKFFLDYMTEDPQTGYLLSGPSISPETSFLADDGRKYSLSMMPTIDRAVIYDIYHACIESCRILDIDPDFRLRLERDIQKLPPYKVRANGELAEWYLDVGRSDNAHRHASHLLGLYPLGQISPDSTPELAQACATFLKNQTAQPSWEDTEWTRGNNICFYARLLDGEKAYENLRGLYDKFLCDNLMTVSPAGVAGAENDIFSFDATEAAVAGMCEMLLQSHNGVLHFLPALPKAWSDGEVKGLCARGGIVADIVWKDGKVVTASLLSKVSQTIRVRINGADRHITLMANIPYELSPKATPPMGWMTWNLFQDKINEQLIREMADAMVDEGYWQAGYEYIFIDDCWQGGRDNRNNLIPDPQKFPSGMKALADYVHERGLKLGIYSDAAQLTCGGYTASYGFEEQDAKTFAEWGIDYLKYDYCNAPSDSAEAHRRYHLMADALAKSGRNIKLGICEWGQHHAEQWAKEAGGCLFRTSGDVRDMWRDTVHRGGMGILDIINITAPLRQDFKTGCWFDMDMLVAGLYGQGGPSSDLGGTGCTDTDYQTQMSLWCMMASPLAMSHDLRHANQTTRDILLNPEIISINQDALGLPAERKILTDTHQVFVRILSEGNFAIAVLNTTEQPLAIHLDFGSLGLKGRYCVRDVWQRRAIKKNAGSWGGTVRPHETKVLRLSL